MGVGLAEVVKKDLVDRLSFALTAFTPYPFRQTSPSEP
jgi:hypothetical protein